MARLATKQEKEVIELTEWVLEGRCV